MIITLLQVALGGAIGASARYLTNIGFLRLLGPGFPYATLVVNITGSFLMGLIATTLAFTNGTRFAPFLLTGILGGFTTFSAFSLDVITLWQRDAAPQAMVYIAASVILSLAALLAGMSLARGAFA
jgi:CrcB protein